MSGKPSARVRAARLLAPWLLRGLAGTWRFAEVDERGVLVPRRRRLDPAVYALWHAELLPLMLGYASAGIVAMISHHRDGDIAADILEALGGTVVRGSSSSGGGEALQAMVDLGRAGRPLAITPDGPRGPAGRGKPGVVRIASATGLPVVPVAARPVRGWRLRSWDRFIVPRPFTTVHVEFAPRVRVPRDLAEDEIPAWLTSIDAAISAAGERCGRRASGRDGDASRVSRAGESS